MPSELPAGVTVDWDGPVQRWSGDGPGYVVHAELADATAADVDRLIERTVSHYRARGESFEWKTFAHDRGVSLPERLTAAGFVAEPRETVLVGAVAQLAVEPSLPAGVTLREVTARADLQRIAAAEREVWGTSKARDHLADSLARRIRATPDEITVLVAEAGGQVVSAGWLVLNPGTTSAGLWGGATLDAWRGQGIYRALVARRAQLARAVGVDHLQVDASDDSRPILERLGFQVITTTTPYIWTP